MTEVTHHSRPFGVTEAELLKVESFCAANKLDEIGRICAELRVLRAEYITLCKRVGMSRATVPDPITSNKRYGAELEHITTDRTNHAPPIT